MKTSVIKPGYLVSLKTSLRGGVNYKRVDLEQDHTTEDGARLARWETAREIPDPAEFEAATIARGASRLAITRVCCATAFGLLCPSIKEGELFDAIAEARAIADKHNAGARLTHIDVYTLVGRVAQDDAEAARAIGAEVRELLDAMRAGIADADPGAIREAANKAKNLGAMLSADVAGQVTAAIVEARAAAREITKRVEKAGETAAAVVAELQTARIDGARFTFLDLDTEAAEVDAIAPTARGLDMEPAAPGTIQAAPAAYNFALEF